MQSSETTETGAGEQKYRDESAATKLWAVYISEAEKYDKALVNSWRSDMDSLLIFAGLFSASLTAFLIESYGTLTQDQGDATIAVLMQISRQISASGNSSSVELPMPSVFRPSAAALTCNTLWFISLGLSLSCALIATLVEQWARDFIQKTDMRPSPIIRARIFSYLYYGIRRFNMHAVVELIPLLLHISVILFFAGLVAFLHPVNSAIMAVAAALLLIILSIYGYLTVLPIFHSDCPFRTPLSGLLRLVCMQASSLWTSSFPQKRENDAESESTLFPPSTNSDILTLTEVMTKDATRDSPERADRDCRALVWTMKSLTADNELEPFIEALPDVIWGGSSPRQLYDEQIQALLRHPEVCLLPRIEGLLRSCEGGLLSAALRQRRQIACLRAIWALAHLAFESEEPFYGFNFELVVHTENFDTAVQPYLASATALARFNFARWYERERRRVGDIVNHCRNQIGTTLPDLTRIVSLFKKLERHLKNPVAVVRFDPDSDYWDYRPQLPVEWTSRGRTISLLSSPDVRQWLDDFSVVLKSRSASLAKILWVFVRVTSDLDSAPYELRSTLNAMVGDGLRLSKTDMMAMDSTFRHITSPRHLRRLKTHPAVHHIDVIISVFISLWQTGSEESPHGVDLSESLLRYIGSRDADEALVVALGGCDHSLLSAAISAHLRQRWWPAEDFKFLWRLCTFYRGFGTTARRGQDFPPAALRKKIPSGFDSLTVSAVKEGAPPDISPSVVPVIELLILKSQEFAPAESLLGWRAWNEARYETHWLILTEFLEQCGVPSLPYKALETLEHILSEPWRPQKVDPVLQRRFATSLMGLMQRDNADAHPHIELVHQLVGSFVFKWYTLEAVSQTTFKFNDPGAGGVVLDALEHFMPFASQDLVYTVRIIITNLRHQHSVENVEAAGQST
ncbi:hypothetical protein MVEN_01717900 [Mycena venus]|uniref:DUF6535 domain-containing protein n=1 Tax=Mycena venus TaxID=2733690 RepID=A0A8H6XPK7_9AGAR|nr:hypothetical protein MVEN_01717900 [Mycena venus]